MADLIDQLKKIIKSMPLYEDQNNGEVKVANPAPLQAICALHELLKNTQLKEICLNQFPELFSILLTSICSYMGALAPAIKKTDSKEKYSFSFNRDAFRLMPAKVAIETFRLFLICCEFDKMATSLLMISSTDAFEDVDLFLEVKLLILFLAMSATFSVLFYFR